MSQTLQQVTEELDNLKREMVLLNMLLNRACQVLLPFNSLAIPFVKHGAYDTTSEWLKIPDGQFIEVKGLFNGLTVGDLRRASLVFNEIESFRSENKQEKIQQSTDGG